MLPIRESSSCPFKNLEPEKICAGVPGKNKPEWKDSCRVIIVFVFFFGKIFVLLTIQNNIALSYIYIILKRVLRYLIYIYVKLILRINAYIERGSKTNPSRNSLKYSIINKNFAGGNHIKII